MAARSVDEWKARIEPSLSSSLQVVSEKITQTEEVQTWLHDASMAAAEGLGQVSGVQGEMMGYMRMLDALEEQLPNLIEAVDELTDGCGEVDLHWRPLQPNFSRLYVSFDCDYSVEKFLRLSACTETAAREAIAAVGDALPEGAPFPNRPNEATGLVAREGRSIGVRVREHLREGGTGTARTVTLLPPDRQPEENLQGPEAVRRLLRALCSEEK